MNMTVKSFYHQTYRTINFANQAKFLYIYTWRIKCSKYFASLAESVWAWSKLKIEHTVNLTSAQQRHKKQMENWNGGWEGEMGWRVSEGSVYVKMEHTVNSTSAQQRQEKQKENWKGGGGGGGEGGVMGRGYVDFRDPGVGGRCPVL